MPDVVSLTEFWARIWEHGERVQEHPWMERVKQDLGIKITQVKKFVMQVENVRKVVRKKKNWSGPKLTVSKLSGERS